jgi:hypothetical protein
MAFTSFKNLTEVVTKYKLYYDIQPFIEPSQGAPKPSEQLSSILAFNLNETAYGISEAAICESIIYPILQDVWKPYKDKLFIWSHTSIQADEILTGIPDYIIAKKSVFGRILGTPLIATIEAKKDNFDEGWTQCAAQLVAMQKINANEQHSYTLYGIVTNGEQWEFGRLDQQQLIKHNKSFSVFDLPALYTALHTLIGKCYEQVE